MIQLEGVEKSFGTSKILHGISFEVPRGETICLIGGSGTGKSVTLKHIMRLLEPDAGRIIFDGEDISHARGRKLEDARKKMGVLFQSGALLNWLTIGENVALPLRENTRMSNTEIDKQVMATLELLQIPHARDLFPNQISGGMKKRAGLARAVVWKPPCILYDEPTSGLDPVITALVDEMILDMRAKLGATQVIITHDMTSAYRVADKIAMLYKGRVIEVGSPDQIRGSKNPVVHQFIEGLVSGPITEGMRRVGDASGEFPRINAAGAAAVAARLPTRSNDSFELVEDSGEVLESSAAASVDIVVQPDPTGAAPASPTVNVDMDTEQESDASIASLASEALDSEGSVFDSAIGEVHDMLDSSGLNLEMDTAQDSGEGTGGADKQG